MKRTVVAAFAFLLATTLSAAEAHQYLVATKRPFAGTRSMVAMFRDVEPTFAPTDVTGFTSVNGFAATMTDDEAAALRKSPEVRWVEEAVERHVLATESRNLSGQTVPYGIDAVRAREAWVVGRGTQINVVVGDTGIDYNHPELKGIYAGGFNTITKTNDPLDDHGHGTHVSGTIAAADNAAGVVGIAPNVRLWSVKVLNANGTGFTSNTIAMIDWILAKKNELGGNWVLNLSLGSSKSSTLEKEAFARLTDAGVVVCAASGNDSVPGTPAPVGFPAGYPGVLAIGAVDSANAIADFSNQGPELALVAPGVSVLSTARLGTGSLSAVQHGGLDYDAVALVGAKQGKVSGEFVYCNLGGPNDFTSAVAGKIALIQRGGNIAFSDKTRRAKEAGAIAVAIYNNVPGALNPTLIPSTANEPGDPYAWTTTYEWPVAVFLSQTDGEAIRAKGGSMTLINVADDYVRMSGTSMATPHATGVAALVWSIAPNATPTELKNALIATAKDLGSSGKDPVFGAGLVDALTAAKTLAPNLFGSGATPVPPPSSHPTTGRSFLKRGGH